MNATSPLADPATVAGHPPRVVKFELSFKSLLAALGVIAGFWLVLHALPVLVALVAALMIIGALNPCVAWLERKKMPRFPAICVVFGLGTALALAFAVLTVPTVLAQGRDVVEHEAGIRGKIADYLERSPVTATLGEGLRGVRYQELIKSSSVALFSLGTRGLEIVAYFFAAVFLAFYMMIDHDRLRGALYAVVPRSYHIRLSRILLNLGTIVGGYIRGQALTCLLMGGFILVLLLACGVPNALAIAVFGGVMDLFPYIGIFLTMGPAVFAASGQGAAVATIVFVLMLAYEELESRVLVPLVYGRAMRLPSSVVLFSLILGATLAGIVGALLALPIAAVVLMLLDELRVELPGQTIQAADLDQRREDNRGEKEYERRSEHMTAEKASAVAVEISGNRKQEEIEAAKARAELVEKAVEPPG